MNQQRGALGLGHWHLERQIPVRGACARVGEAPGEVSVDRAALIHRQPRIYLCVQLCHQLCFERAIVIERLELRRVGGAKLGLEQCHMPGHQCRAVGDVNAKTYD